jgi:hypothetical protein
MLSRLFLCRPVHGLVELETAYEVLLPLIIVVVMVNFSTPGRGHCIQIQ